MWRGKIRVHYLFETLNKVANLTSLATETCCREAGQTNGSIFRKLPEALLCRMPVPPFPPCGTAAHLQVRIVNHPKIQQEIAT